MKGTLYHWLRRLEEDLGLPEKPYEEIMRMKNVDLLAHCRRLQDSKPEPFKPRTLTYYASEGGSFNVISRHHIEALRAQGWEVEHVKLPDLVRGEMRRSSFGVIHPFLYTPQLRDLLPRLRRRHRFLVGFDLADTDRISPGAAETANLFDLVCVPSTCSREAYLRSGVVTRTEVIPHGLSPEYSLPRQEGLPEVPAEGVKVLFFVLHSGFRKGADVVASAMRRVLAEHEEAHLVVKIGEPLPSILRDLPRTVPVDRWLSGLELVRLYDSCDILLAPSRGGGFELNALEAMARGLVTVTSDWPAIAEYGRGALIIRSRGPVTVLPDNPVHTGFGVDPDPEHAYATISQAVLKVKGLRRIARRRAAHIRRESSWSGIMERFTAILEDLEHASDAPPRQASTFGGEDYERFYGYVPFRGKTILDVGADWGSTAYFFLSKGAERVFAVEPHEPYFRELAKYAEAEGRVTAIRTSIDSSRTLSDLIKEFSPDIVKTDCEGCETHLLGVEPEIARIPSEYILESHSDEIHRALVALLIDLGFHVERDDNWTPGVWMTYLTRLREDG